MSPARQDGIDVVIDLLTRLAAGELDARGTRTHRDEDLDAIILGINMLAEELAAHRDELEERVRVRTAELEVARREASEASRMKSEFLATMSHEIRTPMNGVIGLTQLLGKTELVGAQRHYVDGLQRAGDALLSVINDVLDFSKLEADKVVLEVADLDPRLLVEKIVSLLAVPAAEKQIELVAYCTADVPRLLVGDEGRLSQILLNLAANAVKFTEKGQVVLTASVTDRTGDHVRIRFQVADTGIGISEEAQPTLFESFTQADASTTRQFGGSGLGLAISRKLSEVMDGTIGVESEEGRGSTFWIDVPMPVSASARTRVADTAPLAGRRALIAVGEPAYRGLFETQLDAWGMSVEFVAEPYDLPHRLRAARVAGNPFQLVVVDADVAGVDGWGVAHAVAAEASGGDSRLLVLSPTLDLDPHRLARFDDHELMCKPLLPSELLERLLSLMSATPATTRTIATSPLAAAASTRGLVLVVEDNEVNQMVAEAMVERLGYEVDVVTNGVEAIAAVAACRYSAVLMDCHMPVLDGVSATEHIRADESTGSRTPIIAMTAGVTLEERRRCLAAGMDDFISKPVDLDALRRTLAKWGRPCQAPGRKPPMRSS